VGSTPVAINQASQIVLNSSGFGYTNVFLATPVMAPQPPPPGAVLITVTANVANQVFTVSGSNCAPGTYTTPQTLQWAPGASCTVAFVSPYSLQTGTQYVLTGWQDGNTTNPRTIIVPAQAATYTATFKTQYLVSVVASPPQGGTVAGGGWVDANATATLTATASTGYRFVNWSGAFGSSPANPLSVQVNSPQTNTANFEPATVGPPGNWTVLQIAASGMASGMNSYGQVSGFSISEHAFLWTPVAANSPAGSLTDLSTSSPGSSSSAAAAVNDLGQVLLSGGVPFNTPAPAPANLWTPTTPHGTSGTSTTISTDSGSSNSGVAPALNNFGQVATTVGGSPAIWTPTQANGVTGVATPNAQFQGLRAMNSYGQAVMSSSSGGPCCYSYPGPPLLFTPTVRNGTVGTFSAIVGLAGSTQDVLAGINDNGVVVGYSCVAQGSGSCQNTGFIWTPASPNGASGTTVQMPLPTNFVAVTPAAINAAGNIVGTMTPSTGTTVPFLYSGGTYYDLTTISGVPVGSTPVAINQASQIVLNSSGFGYTNVFLATPQTKRQSEVGAYDGGYWVLDQNGNFMWDGTSVDKLIFWSLGRPGEIPVYGDWNGDGRTKIGLYVDGTWLLDYNGNGIWDGPNVDKLVYFGGPGYTPYVGDWNGSGTSKIAVYQDGTWLIDYNGNFAWDGPAVDKLIYFGGPGYTPVLGDWSGSGTTKLGVHQNGTWLLDYNGNFAWDGPTVDKLIFFGGPGYTPVVGDWNGSGSTKVGAYLNGQWILDYNGNFAWDGTTVDRLLFFGGTGYIPAVGDWNGSGTTKVGAYLNGQWVLDVNGNFIWDPPTDQVIFFGGPGQIPIVGHW
jgi:probable HAF family extracellular repeat protein